jgi:Protein of unknown function (DUF1573)
MKKAWIIALLISVSTAVASARQAGPVTVVAEQPAALMQWDSTQEDLGRIAQGQPVTVTYQFVNKGKTPLVISEVKASCGCTAAEYPRTPVAPGQTGLIKAVYNAASAGRFHKTLTVISNAAESQIVLTLTGEVVQP